MNIPTVYSGYMDPQQNRDNTLDDFALVANEVSDWGCLVVKEMCIRDRYMIFNPWDGHKPKAAAGEPMPIKKIIVKIKEN